MDDLLTTLSESRLPALPSEPAEPREPIETSDVFEHGRSPADVLQSRETRLPADDERRYEVDGVRYSAKELDKSGLLEDLAITHTKHAELQEQYNRLVAERQRAQTPAPPAQITNDAIARVYDPVAEIIIDDLVSKDLIEQDLPEAYPRAVRTMVGQARLAFDKIAQLEMLVIPLIAEITEAKKRVQSQVVANSYNAELDTLVAKDPQFYAGLKNRKTRDLFTEYLVDEVGATVGQTTGKGAQAFLSKQWAAFNADGLLDAAKAGVAARKQRNLRRFIGGEGTGSRMGVVTTGEESMLDRMISNSGKIAE